MKKFLVPCTCGCQIVAVVEFEAYEDDPQQFFVEFYTATRPGEGRLDRAKTAWRVLRGQDPWMHDVCWDANAVRELRDFLDSCIADPDYDHVPLDQTKAPIDYEGRPAPNTPLNQTTASIHFEGDTTSI